MIGFLVQISSVKIYVMVTGVYVGDGDFSVEECDTVIVAGLGELRMEECEEKEKKYFNKIDK